MTTKIKRTAYFNFSKLGCNKADEHFLERFIKKTNSFAIYSVKEVAENKHLIWGSMILNGRLSTFEAAGIFTGWNMEITDDFNLEMERLLVASEARTINNHPCADIKVMLEPSFNEEAYIEDLNKCDI